MPLAIADYWNLPVFNTFLIWWIIGLYCPCFWFGKYSQPFYVGPSDEDWRRETLMLPLFILCGPFSFILRFAL